MGRNQSVEVDLNVDDLLTRVRFKVDHGRPHIVLHGERCWECGHESCLYVCPVEAYQRDGAGMRLHWEKCVECGACMHVCDRAALDWEYPGGGYGVCFRLG